MSDDGVFGWRIAGLIALSVIVLAVPFYLARETQRNTPDTALDTDPADFVGREQCIKCHSEAYEKWLHSHHDDAMDMASEQTVLGDFNDAEFEHGGVTSRFYRKGEGYFVFTEGPGGGLAEFKIAYTFGVEPLQQYLIPFPGGRLQALSIAWDTERERWFSLNENTVIAAGDWLHWTRNGQNWNGMCAECHSTHLRKGYNPESRTFDTTWSELDVSCEACHGPGSRHVAWAEIEPMGRPLIEDYGLLVSTSGIDSKQQVELCAPCHSRRGQISDYDHQQVNLMDNLQPSLLRDGVYHVDGQILDEDYVWGSFVQSKMYQNGVRCSDCHDVHSLELHQPGNELCLQCHRADTYDAYEHHFHQKVYAGQPSDGALCVKCHMPEQAYMVVDYRADHSLRVPRPDLSLEIGVPNACSQSGCHDDKSLEWAAEAFTEWYGKARKPHFGTILAAARAFEPDAIAGLITLAQSPLYPAIVRATALSELQSYPGEQASTAMQRALGDDDPLLRHAAVQGLVSSSPEELVGSLAALLFDPIRAVRIQAAARLGGADRGLFKAYQLEAFDTALAEYIEAMRASLDFASSGMNLGNLYAAQGDTEMAEHYYRMALEVDDLFYPVKMNLATLLSRKGPNLETERLLREVLEVYPERYDAAYSLALVLVSLNRTDEALTYLAQASEGSPLQARVHYNYGLLLAQKGRDVEAETAMQKALELAPQSIDYLYALIDFYYKRSRTTEALNLVEQLLAAHPDNVLGHNIKSAIEGG